MRKPLFFLLLLLFVACSKPKVHDVVITDVNIIDVETGEVLPHRAVAIDSDTISAIYTEAVSISDSVKIIHGTDKYLIPGLWDMHVHHNWNYKDANPLMIANGVVGVREMWGDMDVYHKLKDSIAGGSKEIPDIYVGSVIIDGKPKIWPGSIEVANAEDARRAAMEQIESGVDFLKVYSLLSPESFDAIADVANERGVPFAGHVPDAVSIFHAADRGMVSAEHMFGVPTGASSLHDSLLASGVSEFRLPEASINSFDQVQFDSMNTFLAEKGLWMCPTLVANKGGAYMLDTAYTNDDRVAYLPDYMAGMWQVDSAERKNPRSIAFFESQKLFYDNTLKLVGPMSEAGVKFLAGTDYPNPWCHPGFSLHDEMALMVEGGMDNLLALQTATLNPAIFMKNDDYGNIEVGKKASLVLLGANPLEDISNTKSIEAVIVRGGVFEREELDENLEHIRFKLANQFKVGNWLKTSIKSFGIKTALDSLDFILANENVEADDAEKDINSIGYELMMYGAMDMAKEVFKKNTELFPESYNVYDSYGELLMNLGEFEESMRNYEKALELNPDSKNARTMLDSLKSGNFKPPSGARGMRNPIFNHIHAHLNAAMQGGHQHE